MQTSAARGGAAFAHVLVTGPARPDQTAAYAAVREGLRRRVPIALVADDPQLADGLTAPSEPGVTLFTSGSTGVPKRVNRPWQELEAEVSPHAGPDDRFLLTYSVARYAGLQVALHCARHDATLLVPETLADVEAIVTEGERGGATHLSATPSLLRRILMAGGGERMATLRQVTLGGEYATQPVLDLVRRAWPEARVTAIYASSEAGACFAASDGLEGFPSSVLERGRSGRRGRLSEEGELIVTLENGRVVETGDLFDQQDGRLLYRGRRQEIVNVGGHKVSPVRVERVVAAVPGVEACRVFGTSSPVTGQVLVAEVVGTASKGDIRSACRAQLSRPEQPALIRFVDEIALSGAGKTLRSAES